MNRIAFRDTCVQLGLDLSSAQLDRFEAFEANLYQANAVMNLTRVPREECWRRHFVDSLLLHDLIPLGSQVLDIGTGPGFPAWPLAGARPDLNVVAIDSSSKMVGFLNRNSLPNLKPVQVRAEEWNLRDAFDIVTGRAVAPLGTQLELSAPLCRVGGAVIPMRTPSERALAEADVKVLGLALVEALERRLPGTDIDRFFPVYRKVGRTPARYPRSWATMKREPLI